MLSCRQATELISQSMDRALTARERFGLIVHQAICKGCRATSAQMQFLRRATLAWRQQHQVSELKDRDGDQHAGTKKD